MEKIKWSAKVTNEEVLESIGEKKTLLNILRRKNNWIGVSPIQKIEVNYLVASVKVSYYKLNYYHVN